MEAAGGTPFVAFESNTETTYSMMKGKLGSSSRSKSDVGQINEALCKVLYHNLCVLVQEMHDLGIESAFRTYSRSISLKIGQNFG